MIDRICVAYRPDGGRRDLLWAHCRRWWKANFPTVRMVVADGGPGLFKRSAAFNQAARGDWNLAAFIDADVLLETPGQLAAAAVKAQNTGKMIWAQNERVPMTEEETEWVLAGAPLRGTPYPAPAQHSHVQVFRRDLWDWVGGFDERFVGWGYEDVVLQLAVQSLVGWSSVAGKVFHLWHPQVNAERQGHPHFQENERLHREYKDVYDQGPHMMGLYLEGLKG